MIIYLANLHLDHRLQVMYMSIHAEASWEPCFPIGT